MNIESNELLFFDDKIDNVTSTRTLVIEAIQVEKSTKILETILNYL